MTTVWDLRGPLHPPFPAGESLPRSWRWGLPNGDDVSVRGWMTSASAAILEAVIEHAEVERSRRSLGDVQRSQRALYRANLRSEVETNDPFLRPYMEPEKLSQFAACLPLAHSTVSAGISLTRVGCLVDLPVPGALRYEVEQQSRRVSQATTLAYQGVMVLREALRSDVGTLIEIPPGNMTWEIGPSQGYRAAAPETVKLVFIQIAPPPGMHALPQRVASAIGWSRRRGVFLWWGHLHWAQLARDLVERGQFVLPGYEVGPDGRPVVDPGTPAPPALEPGK